MRRYPETFKQYIELEQKIGHSWKAKKSLKELWVDCMDIDDVVAENIERNVKNNYSAKTSG